MTIPRKTLKKGGSFILVQITTLALVLNLLTPFFYAYALDAAQEPEEVVAEEVASEEEVVEEVAEEEVIEEETKEEIADTEEATDNEEETIDEIEASTEASIDASTEDLAEAPKDDDPKENDDDKNIVEEVIETIKEMVVGDDEERGIWEENEDGSMTVLVEEDEKYEYKDSGLKIKFTRIDGELGIITVKKIELTNEQIEELNALSDTAWKITSDMENGTFEYDLTLPVDEDVELDKKDVMVVYLEDEEALEKLTEQDVVKNVKDDAEKVEIDVNTKKNTVEAKNLDHFTLLAVTKNGSEKITICHRTNSHFNQYGPEAITVDKSSVFRNNGHDSHDGPIWFSGITEKWGDIIPPFDYDGGSYEGKNWTTEGETIWSNNCQIENTQELTPPVQTGYNEDNGDDFAIPRPPSNEFACLGGITNINGISVHWTHDLDGQEEYLKYDRQYNKEGVYGWRGSEKYTDPYTNYRTFGGNPGSEGTYGSQVRAWIDSNDNGLIDDGETVSGWSNECSITYDQIEEIPVADPVCGDGKMYVKINTEYNDNVWYGDAIAPKNDWFELLSEPVVSTKTEGVVLTQSGTDLTVDLLKREDNSRQDFEGTIEFYYGVEVTGLAEGTDFYKLEDENNCGSGCHMDDFSEISKTEVNVDFAVTSAHDRGIISFEQVEVLCLDACENDFSVNNAGDLSTINLSSRLQAHVGALLFGSSAAASDPATGDVYYIERFGGDRQLAFYDLDEHKNVLVGHTGTTAIIDKMTFDATGKLYAMSTASELFTIDLSIGSATSLGTVSEIDQSGGDLVFDDRGDLYAHVKGGKLYKVNLSDLSTTVVNETGIASTGMTFKENGEFYATDNANTLFSFKHNSGVTTVGSTNPINDLASCPVELSVADVTLCKVDENEVPLSEWDLQLLGELVNKVIVPTDTGTVVDSTDLSENNYVLVAKGTYEYRGGTGLLSDPNFSQRSEGDQGAHFESGTEFPYWNWANVKDFKPAWKGYLGVMVNGTPTNWSNDLASDHKYARGYENYSGPFNFTVLDSYYGDNVGDLEVDIYKGYAGVTGDDGCVTFENVPHGAYTVDETLKEGWMNESGLGDVTINAETTTLMVINSQESTCEPGEAWADEVVENSQGTLKNGAPITDPERIKPGYVLGEPDEKFFSLGYGGSITVKFEYPVLDEEENDLSFHEVTWGRDSYPVEKARVEVSPDGSVWKEIGEVTNKDGGDGVGYLDFSQTGWSWIQYVRVSDITDDPAHNETADGYDLDAVDAVYGICETPESECGDGIKTDPEECDGTDGVTPGEDFCTVQCELKPIYNGLHECSPGTTPVLKNSYEAGSQNTTGIDVPLTSGTEYLFKTSGTYTSSPNAPHLSDAGYTTIDGWANLASEFGIQGTGNDYAAHALLGDMATGEIGVIDWGDYESDHEYSKVYTPSSSGNAQFVIGDRYGDWFDTPWQAQGGMSDNSGSLTLDVYECLANKDIDGYKRDYETAEPIEEWPIELCRFESDNVANECTQIATTTTDANGYYKFSDLPIGLYKVTEGTMVDYTQMAPTAYIVDLANDTMWASGNMIANGGFEAPVVGGSWDHYAQGVAGLAWDVEWAGSTATYDGYSRPEPARAEIQRTVGGWGDYEGDQYAELDTDWGVANREPANVVLSQEIQTCIGGEYELHYAWSPRPGVNNNQMNVSWETGTDSHSANGGSNTVWTEQARTFTANANTTEISFTENGPENSLGMFLDGVEVVQTNTCPRESVDFYNRKDTPDVQRGSITACKFEDADKNGQQDDGEEMLADWEMTLGNKTQTTDANGCTIFDNLPLGKYTVTEEDRNGWEVTTGSLSQDITLGAAVEDYHKTATFGNWYQTTDVTVCKEDENSNGLAGWEMILSSSVDGPTNINVSSGAGTDSADLEAGQYLVKVSGTYRYGNSAMIADAGYSYRPMNIPAGCDCWLSGFDLPSGSNGLMAWINGVAIDWGDYNSGHEYSYVYTHAEGPVNLSLYDNYYGDNLNNGNFQFEIFKIEYQGTTGGEHGCIGFEDVPWGDYDLDEILQAGWEYVGGGGDITISDESNEFTIVNRELLGNLQICKFEDNNGNGTKNDGEEYIEWEVGIEDQAPVNRGDDGCYTWHDLPEGDYTVFEVEKDGWTMTTDNNNSTHTVSDDEMTTVEFGNFELGTVSGQKWSDDNMDGEKNGEVGLNDWTIVMGNYTKISEHTIDPKSSTPVELGTSVNGTYYVLKVSGTYGAGDMITADAECSSRDSSPWNTIVKNYESYGEQLLDLEINSAKTQWGTCNTANHTYSKLIEGDGSAFSVLINDIYRPNNTGHLNVAVYRLDNTQITSTSNEGNYAFADLETGDYAVCEMHQEGWLQTYPQSEQSGGCHLFTIDSGASVTDQDFGNVQLGSIHGYKWSDLDGDKERGEEEELMAGWRIFIDGNRNKELDEGERYMDTSSDEEHFGWYWFEDLLPGNYSICEIPQEGWLQIYPIDLQCHEVSLPSDGNQEWTENMVEGPEYNFGNYLIPELLITKTNDQHPNILKAGDIVTYTLTVTAKNNVVRNGFLIDLPPIALDYIPNSWTAISSERGDLSNIPGLGLTKIYASPGEWTLGDMLADEIVTLAYQAKISDSARSSAHKDLAWGRGANAFDEELIAQSAESDFDVNQGIVDDAFVGTEVTVDSPSDPESVTVRADKNEVIEEEEVIVKGASTLPATGANGFWLILASVMLLTGLLLIGLSKNKKLRNLLGTVILLGLIAGVGQANAVDSLTVRIDDPNPKVSSAFNLGFVVMDVSGASVNVECWKKGPGDSAFVKFQDLSLIAGGSSGNCQVTESVLNDDGSYSFKVIANGVESDLVGTSYDGTVPGKPKYIEKDEETSCRNEVEFKTANDGQTTYVEIYRSQHSRNITVNEGSRIKTITIGPNQKHKFDDELSATGCGDNYYYAVRAFDDHGNYSPVREEEFEVIITEEVEIIETTEETATETTPVPVTAGETETTDEGTEVAGEETGEEQGEGEGEGEGEGNEGEQETIVGEEGGAQSEEGEETEVLGQETAAKASDAVKDWKAWLIVLILIAVGYWIYKKNKKSPTDDLKKKEKGKTENKQ